jgi:DNA-binding Xre family transcriptional regulator
MSYIKGNRINACLYEKNMTRSELIDKTGIDASMMSKIINGTKKDIRLTTASRIAKALDYPLEVVFIL